MHLKNFLSDFNQIIARLSPYTETGISNVYYDPSVGLIFELQSESDMKDRIKDLESELDDAEKELDRLETELSKSNDNLTVAEEIIDKIKYEDSPGQTLRAYKERAEEAELNAQKWHKECQEMQEELKALRKRKGIEAGLFKNAREILVYLHDSQDVKAQELVTKIHQSK